MCRDIRLFNQMHEVMISMNLFRELRNKRPGPQIDSSLYPTLFPVQKILRDNLHLTLQLFRSMHPHRVPM